jgi:23S rRNA (guanine745-N1)-methyltransferase
MSDFICPQCNTPLDLKEKSFICKSNHTYDISKSGYINLLMSQQVKEKRHGDDKLMVRARRDFLEAGYYDCLLEKFTPMLATYTKSGDMIVDAGCGECWYTDNVYKHLAQKNLSIKILGIDISKNAIDIGAKRNKNIQLAVASVFDIPIKEDSCDIVFSIFAPYSKEEFSRILKKSGILIRIIPLEKHLWSLKKAIYDCPYENVVDALEIEGFELLEKAEIRQTIHLSCNKDIMNLFSMTPYYYKTGKEDQKKLETINELETEIEFGILVYKKN